MPEGSNSRKGGVILPVQSFMVDGPWFMVAGAQCEQGVACSTPIVRSQRERGERCSLAVFPPCCFYAGVLAHGR